jgi:metal-responsive CopG/Arc/MetJ family transcriptional regulator
LEAIQVAKINVSLPEDVLRELDKAARDARTSRSAFLAEAVKHYLEQKEEEQQSETRRQAAASIDRFRETYGGWDGTAEVLRWRDRH